MKKLYLIGNMKMNMSYAELDPSKEYFARFKYTLGTQTPTTLVLVLAICDNFSKYGSSSA